MIPSVQRSPVLLAREFMSHRSLTRTTRSFSAVVESHDDSSSSRIASCQRCSHPSSDCPSQCSTLLDIDRNHVIHPYTSMTDPLPTFPVASAKGVHLELNDGRKLIDGMSSWWAAVHGYRNPVLDAAMISQIENSMSHVMFGGLTHKPAVELTGRLLQMVNNDFESHRTEPALDHFDAEKMQQEYKLNKVFLSDSGSISVEVAMKMALQYWFTLQNNQSNQSSTTAHQARKTKFISLRNGYHGDTFGAMSVCDPVNGMHSMFSGVLAQQFFVDSPSGSHIKDAASTLSQIEEALKQHSHEVAAVIMEPIVQGAGGMNFYHPAVLKRVRELCDDHDVLLIFDEIATGFGRTGALFAGWHDEESYRPWSSLDENQEKVTAPNRDYQSTNSIVYPDILCLGKALTGGYMTMGATITNKRVSHGISDTGGVFMHGPTFMANPLACSVALASINLLVQSPWLERVRYVERSLIKSMLPLAKLDSVREVRVLGAIGVCELHNGLTRERMACVQQELVEEGIWLRPFGKLLYTMPPFNCDDLEEEHLPEDIARSFSVKKASLDTFFNFLSPHSLFTSIINPEVIMASAAAIPTKILLRYFRLATERLQSLTCFSMDGPADLSSHRSLIVNAQLSSLDDALSGMPPVDSSSIDREAVQKVLREIGFGDFSHVDFGANSETADEGEQRKMLIDAMDKTNEAARMAFFNSVISLEWSHDGSDNRSDRTLRRDDSLDRSSILEFCGLMMTAVRSDHMQKFLRSGQESIFYGNNTNHHENGRGALSYGESIQDRMMYMQKLCWKAVGWEPDIATDLLNKLVSSLGHHSELELDDKVIETLTKYTSAMTVAITNTLMVGSTKTTSEDGTTRIVNVSYSEKIVSVPQSAMEAGNLKVSSLFAPASNTMHEHTSSSHRKQLEIAQKTANLQKQIWNEFQSLSLSEQTKTLEKAKLAQEEFLEKVRRMAPGPERVLMMQSIDVDVQKLLIIHKLWISQNDSILGSG
ncbi:hypothetical protein ACHAXS_010880 [Conticribra weissflogii]